MEEFRIVRSHGPDLVFRGVLVTTVSGNPDNEGAPGRWHEISVYRGSENVWVASIHYRTRYADEREHTEADILEDASEIETLLLSYEPWEHINRRALDRLSSDDRKRLSNRIWTNYLDLVNRALEGIVAHLPSPAKDAAANTPSEE